MADISKITFDNNTWNIKDATARSDLLGKESTSNKTTTLSSTSTDTQYPSAKCVYDIIGDVESLLAAI